MQHESKDRRGLRLAIGFAATVAMWAVAYVAMMRPGQIAGELLFALMGIILVLAARMSAKFEEVPTVAACMWAGAKVGAFSAVANLLLIGSLVGGGEAGVLRQFALWSIGLFGASIVCGALGGVWGRAGVRWRSRVPATGLFGLTTAAAIFLLLVTGGLVTGLEAGLAVPDWPNSFGHNMLLYPLAEMKDGVYYEHAHRLYGMLVGLCATLMLVLTLMNESRGWVRALAVAGFLMVCVQGLMGGLRVTGNLTLSQDASQLAPSIGLAVAHGVFGQIVFSLFCLLAVVCGARWSSSEVARPVAEAPSATLPTALVAVLLVQLISGALYRHLQIPVAGAAPTYPTWAMHLHLTFAVVAFVATLWTGLRAMRMPPALRPLRAVGHGLLMAVGLQVVLGILALVMVITRKTEAIPLWEVVFTSLHQVTGAVLLATSVLLAAWWRRLIVPQALSQALPVAQA
ncbi:MAG: hypothetical protein EBR10_02815 [Planctomycetes bacterium]|nr:hypothetical protein [Planctomycetota bacterium]